MSIRNPQHTLDSQDQDLDDLVSISDDENKFDLVKFFDEDDAKMFDIADSSNVYEQLIPESGVKE